MDKYEFNIKTEQIKKLIRKKEYVAAAQIADTMDFSKVKNNPLLITVADVYEVIGEYDKARDVLTLAYEKTQLGRQIAFRLARISVKRRDIEEAEEYYEDFKTVAPRDASRYILQYEISKLKGEPVESQIEILEKYVEDDMDDKWTFELAKLYHKAGNGDRCVELCDTIILWFNEGKYVDKAMELKLLHAPLTKSQQQKYDSRWVEKATDINVNDIKVKEVSVDNKYDTHNIQAEIAKSMIELLGKESENATSFGSEGQKEESIKELSSKEQPIIEIEEEEQIEGQLTLDDMLNGLYKPEDTGEIKVENDEEEVEKTDEVAKMLVTDIDEVLADRVAKESASAEASKVTEADYDLLDEAIEALNATDMTSDVETLDAVEAMELVSDEPQDEDSLFEDAVEDGLIEDAEEDFVKEPIEEISEEDFVEEPIEDAEEESYEDKPTKSYTASSDAKELIKEFVEHYAGVEGLDKQIIMAFHSLLKNDGSENDFLYVMGDVKSGKTTLAMEVIKLIGKIRQKDTKKIAKVNGQSLTEKNISTFAGKLGECDVVIEKAASISKDLFPELINILESDQIKRVIVFEDEKSVSERYMDENPEVVEYFKNIIVLKHNRIRDWAKVAVDYANEQGYGIDEMGMLALHAKIDQLYALTLVIHKNHVEQLIDIAIEHASRKTIGRLVSGLFKKKDKENVLTESDFLDD